jgi:hypothetical protein
MDSNSTGCNNTIGSSSAPSAPSLLDRTMPPMLNVLGLGLDLQQLLALKILVQLSHKNLRNLSKHQRFGNILLG